MAGDDEIYNAVFEKYKAHRADNVEELYDFAKALAYSKKPQGQRLLHISSSGGAAILAIDEAENTGSLLRHQAQSCKRNCVRFCRLTAERLILLILRVMP